jgi:hypothetical protein
MRRFGMEFQNITQKFKDIMHIIISANSAHTFLLRSTSMQLAAEAHVSKVSFG